MKNWRIDEIWLDKKGKTSKHFFYVDAETKQEARRLASQCDPQEDLPDKRIKLTVTEVK